jgi:sec-independent protein translocase protein TatA
MNSLLAYGMPGLPEMLLLAFIGLLIFGKRLPEVGRSIGKGIVEFKKGLRSIDDDIDEGTKQPPAQAPAAQIAPTQQPQVAPAFRFDPYTGKPITGDTVVSTPQNSQTPQT